MIKNLKRIKKIELRAVVAFMLIAMPSLSQAQNDQESAESVGTLEEIIVTAQRRSESLQDAAIAIDAFDQDTLTRSGIESGLDLAKLSPSLGISAGGGATTSIFLRGVGSFTTNALADAAVAQNYDGVYLGRASSAAGQGFYDLERVELLKGPQGTLYGRNATGGVINYIPKKPVIGESSGYGQLEIGNYGKLGAQGAANFSVGETSAMRVAANYVERDGFSDDGTNDADSYSVRAQLLTEPTENLSLRFSVDHSDVGGKGRAGSVIGSFNTTPGQQLTDYTPSNLDVDSGPTAVGANEIRTGVLAAPAFAFLPALDADSLFQDLSYSGVSAELNYSTDFGVLTVLPAYRESDQSFTFVGPGFQAAAVEEKSEQTTLEVRFATELDGAFNGVFGLYYFDEEVDTSSIFNQVYVAPVQNYLNGGNSFAAFGHGTLDLSETFRLNAGARYTEDEKFVNGTINTFITFCGGAPGAGFLTPPDSFMAGCAAPGGLPIFSSIPSADGFISDLVNRGFIPQGSTASDGFYPLIGGAPGVIIDVGGNATVDNKVTFDEVTYRLGAEWDVAEDSLIYLSYERGYRSGGVDVSNVDPTYEPEFVNALTLGSKNRFFNNSLQLNVEVFLWDYEDQQVSYLTTVNGGPDFPTANGDSTIQGIDIDLMWALNGNTQIGAKVQYLDSEYDNLELFSDVDGGRFGCPASGVNDRGFQLYDCSGQRLLYSPELSVDLSLSHQFELGDFDIVGAADVAYRDEQLLDFSLLPETIAGASTTLDLEATLLPADASWALTAYVRNATDERYPTSSNLGVPGILHQVYNSPRTYGLRFRADF